MPDPATTPAHEGGEHRAKLVRVFTQRQFECSCGFRTRIADCFDISIFDIEDEFRAHLRAALAGTSADAGARETVTFWTRDGDANGVLKSIVRFVGHGFKAPGQTAYSVAITVTPGKERGK